MGVASSKKLDKKLLVSLSFQIKINLKDTFSLQEALTLEQNYNTIISQNPNLKDQVFTDVSADTAMSHH